MAEIFAFPAGNDAMGRAGGGTGIFERPSDVPGFVWNAVESVRAMRRVPGVRYREISVPPSLCDYGIGVEMQSVLRGAVHDACGVRDGGESDGGWESDPCVSGWIMVLYAGEPPRNWRSCWRCVAFARIPLERRENDGLAPAMYWDEMRTFLDEVCLGEADGTVTVTRDTSFGSLHGDGAGCEMRVSWTPLENREDGVDAGAQVSTWARFVHAVAVEEEPSVDR